MKNNFPYFNLNWMGRLAMLGGDNTAGGDHTLPPTKSPPLPVARTKTSNELLRVMLLNLILIKEEDTFPVDGLEGC